jgi:subtilisin-like proprotein convertase family protein
VPKNIVDAHPKKGTPRPVTSELTPTVSETVDTVTVNATIIDAEWDDLTVTLAHPDGGSAVLTHLNGDQWQVVDAMVFQGQALDRTWTLTIADNDYNGITGTLTAWSITVMPMSEAAGGSSQAMAAASMTLASPRLVNDSTAKIKPSGQAGPALDASDSVVHVDDTTMYVSPSEPTAPLPDTEPAAVDAAMEELDLGPLDDEIVEDLAIALV